MKKSGILLLALVLAGLLWVCASAELFFIPEGTVSIESEAFAQTQAITEVCIPESVTFIAPDAFDETVTAVYGTAGSAAEVYALQSGKSFVAYGITDVTLDIPLLVTPGRSISVTASASSGLPLEYRLVLTNGKKVLLESDWQPEPAWTLKTNKLGYAEAVLYVRNSFGETTLETYFNVCDDFILPELPMRLEVGQSVRVYNYGTYRQVEFTSEPAGAVAVGICAVTARQQGSGVLVGTVTQNDYYPTTYTIRLPYTAVRSVSGIEITNLPAIVYEGDTVVLTSRVSPEDATYPAVTYTSSDPSVLSVTAEGVLTACGKGTCTLTATADGYSQSFEVRVYRKIESMTLIPDREILYTNGTMSFSLEILPEDADDPAIVWSSSDPSVASVDENGCVSGLACGTATLTAAAGSGNGAVARVTLAVHQGPCEILLSCEDDELYPGDSFPITATVFPENAEGKELTWEVLTPETCALDTDNRVSPLGAGRAVVRATAENGVYADIEFEVYDSFAPASLTIQGESSYVEQRGTLALSVSALPKRADTGVTWKSGDGTIATVSGSGVVTGVSRGKVTITAVSNLDGAVKAQYCVVVLAEDRCLVIPERITGEDEIEENLQKIENVKLSAFDQLERLVAEGKMTESVCEQRKEVIGRMFELYAFPWETLSFQEYWKEENSEGGIKHFQPGQVYYGMPYISGTYYNQRLYNPQKALSENRWYLSEEGPWYILNQNNLRGSKYCGTDCSSSVAIAYYTVSGNVASKNTAWFAGTDEFFTLSQSAELYPGDILVKGHGHVVMFLYYADEAQEQILLIQQGGNEVYTNTVSCDIYKLASYYNGSYIPRRYSKWK